MHCGYNFNVSYLFKIRSGINEFVIRLIAFVRLLERSEYHLQNISGSQKLILNFRIAHGYKYMDMLTSLTRCLSVL